MTRRKSAGRSRKRCGGRRKLPQRNGSASWRKKHMRERDRQNVAATRDFESIAAAIPPSDLAGTTETLKGFVALCVVPALETLREECGAALAPLSRRASGRARPRVRRSSQLRRAYSASANEKSAYTFEAFLNDEFMRQSFECFRLLPRVADVDTEELAIAHFDLRTQIMVQLYCRANGGAPAADAALEAAPLEDEEFGVVLYLAGWVWLKVARAAHVHHKDWLPVLEALVLSDDEVYPTDNAAVQYVASRDVMVG